MPAIAGGVLVAVIIVILILFLGMKKGWFRSKKQQPVPGTQSVASPPMQVQAPVAQAQPVPASYPAYSTYSQQPLGPPPPVAPPPEQYTPYPVTEPLVEEDRTPKPVQMPVDVDAEDASVLPTQVPKPRAPDVEARAPIPGPPKKPGFQRPALAKNPQQAPERCPSCGLDVDYESLKCQECSAKLF